MKIVKLLISLALINAVAVAGLLQIKPNSMPISRAATAPETPNAVPAVPASAAPTPIPVAKAKAKPAQAVVKPTVPVAAKTAVASPRPAVTTPTPTPAPQVAVAPAAGCIIQIDGVKYDVTRFRQTHSGGNVFTCNTDMSQIFWSRHNQRILQVMQQYRI